MHYRININQRGIVDAGLADVTELEDWVVLDYLVHWYYYEKAVYTVADGKRYVWVDYGFLMRSLPILHIRKKDQVTARFKRLRAAGLIETVQMPNHAIFVRPTDLAMRVIFNSPGLDGVCGDGVPDYGDSVPDYGDSVPDPLDGVPDSGDTIPPRGVPKNGDSVPSTWDRHCPREKGHIYNNNIYNNKYTYALNDTIVSAPTGQQNILPNLSADKKSTQKGKSPAQPHIDYDFDTRSWAGITDEDRAAWQAAYPACDVDVELRRMGEWLLANPAKRKKNYRRFIVSWLSRQQDAGGTKIINNGKEREYAHISRRDEWRPRTDIEAQRDAEVDAILRAARQAVLVANGTTRQDH